MPAKNRIGLFPESAVPLIFDIAFFFMQHSFPHSSKNPSISLYASTSALSVKRAFAGLVLGRQAEPTLYRVSYRAQCFFQSANDVFPVQKTRSIFAFPKISEKSLGTAFFIDESEAPLISHSLRTSHSAILCRRRNSRRSAIAFSLSGLPFPTENCSPKRAGMIFQNRFCGCM